MIIYIYIKSKRGYIYYIKEGIYIYMYVWLTQEKYDMDYTRKNAMMCGWKL